MYKMRTKFTVGEQFSLRDADDEVLGRVGVERLVVPLPDGSFSVVCRFSPTSRFASSHMAELLTKMRECDEELALRAMDAIFEELKALRSCLVSLDETERISIVPVHFSVQRGFVFDYLLNNVA
jgi:hypothetical protein